MLGDAMAWLPVFFLYFSDHLSLSEVLRLEALYYVAVVLLEVPSGYISDRWGRKVTLVFASSAFVISYLTFIISREFAVFAIAQLALATGMAFRSGTDSAFLFDSLKCLAREEEYGSEEARVQRQALSASAVAVILGGFSAAFDLSYAYWISLFAAAGSLIMSLRFIEPDLKRDPRAPAGFGHQLMLCLRRLKDHHLAWLFSFFVVTYILAHVPYEFYQPYLRLLELADMLPMVNAPEASGLLFGVTMLLGAWVAGRSMDWQHRFGLNTVLLSAVLMQLLVIAVLGLWLHPLVVVVLFLRNTPMALVHAPMYAAIAPRVQSGQRATYLSLQSLAGRLGFSISLFLGSLTIEAEVADWATLSGLLQAYVVFGVIAFAGLYLARISDYD